MAVVLANVAGRALATTGFLWTGEVAQFALSVLTFVGGVVAYRRLQHLPVRALTNLLPPRTQAVLVVLAEWLVLLAAAVVAIASATLVQSTWNEQTPILRIPAASIALPLSAAMALLALYAFERLLRAEKRTLVGVGAVLAALLLLVLLSSAWWQPLVTPTVATSVVLGVFLLTVLAGSASGRLMTRAPVPSRWLAFLVFVMFYTQDSNCC